MKNEYKVTKKLVQSWAKEYHLSGGASIFLFVLWCIFGIIGLAGTILFALQDVNWKLITLYALMFLLAVYKLFFARFEIWSRRYKQMVKTYGVEEWLRTIVFEDGEICLTEHTSTIRYQYSQIVKIKENGNSILLFLNNKTAIRLYKDAFTEGSWDDCKKKILAEMKKF